MIGPSSSCTEVTVTKQKDPEAKETSPAHGMYMPLEELPVADPAVL